MALGLAALFVWAFRRLPQERWQILAALPRERDAEGGWRGVNLTYYGVFNALGGGAFVGIVASPWVVWSVSRLALTPSEAVWAVPSVLGALAPAYAMGEGIGRLACLSVGCCYGRPAADSPAWLRPLFSRWAFVFEGRLKKSAYEHGYEGQRLIPVQALTAVISSLVGLAGVALFLRGRPVAAFVLSIVATQVWRFLSEFLRADYRGAGRVSAYQWMALAGVVYAVMLGLLWPSAPRPAPDVARGLALLWTPGAILFIEAVAVFVLLRMGLSTVTSSRIAFQLTAARLPPTPSPQSRPEPDAT